MDIIRTGYVSEVQGVSRRKRAVTLFVVTQRDHGAEIRRVNVVATSEERAIRRFVRKFQPLAGETIEIAPVLSRLRLAFAIEKIAIAAELASHFGDERRARMKRSVIQRLSESLDQLPRDAPMD